MKEPVKKALKHTAIGFGAIFCLSLYLGGAFQALWTGNAALRPVPILRCMRENGFPASFFVFFLLFALPCGFYAVRGILSAAQEDELGRSFIRPAGRRTYGDAHFASKEEIKDFARVGPADFVTGPILGQFDRDGKQCVAKRLNTQNNNIAVFSSSGKGKSFAFVRTYAYQSIRSRQSCIIFDPSGELNRDLHGLFTEHGYVVKVLNLEDLDRSNTWNCLSSIDPDKLEESVAMISNTVVTNAMEGDTVSIYAECMKQLLNALILRVYLGTEFSDDQKNIDTVYGLVSNSEDPQTLLRNLFEVRGAGQPGFDTFIKPWRAANSASDNLKGNIYVNFSSMLQIFQSRRICTLLSANDIDLSLPGVMDCAYFCIFPEHHRTYKFVSALFITSLFQQLIGDAKKRPDNRLEVDVNFLMDEFASIGIIPDWIAKISNIRKYGINAVMIFQTLGQLRANYLEAWETILANCATWLTYGVNDEETAEYLSRRFGDTTVEVSTERHQANEYFYLGLRPMSTGEGKRALMDAAEIMEMPARSVLISFDGKNPVFAHAFPHILHPYYRELCPDPLGEMPGLDDGPGREERRRREEEMVRGYYREHGDDRRPTEEETDRMIADMKKSARVKKRLLGLWEALRARVSGIRRGSPDGRGPGTGDGDPGDDDEVVFCDDGDEVADDGAGGYNVDENDIMYGFPGPEDGETPGEEKIPAARDMPGSPGEGASEEEPAASAVSANAPTADAVSASTPTPRGGVSASPTAGIVPGTGKEKTAERGEERPASPQASAPTAGAVTANAVPDTGKEKPAERGEERPAPPRTSAPTPRGGVSASTPTANAVSANPARAPFPAEPPDGAPGNLYPAVRVENVHLRVGYDDVTDDLDRITHGGGAAAIGELQAC